LDREALGMSDELTTKEALTQALFLALTAPDQDRVNMAVELAETFAFELSQHEVEQCKRDAMKRAELQKKR
jgi:hypothetical protein